MARHEHDREDLLAAATALVERVSIERGDQSEPIVMGFRDTGAASIYFNADRAYHFTPSGLLRRAHADDLLYKAERGRIIAMRRERRNASVDLVSRTLTADEQHAFLVDLNGRLTQLAASLTALEPSEVQQIPPDRHVIDHCRGWLRDFAGRIAAAASPHA